MNQVCKNDTVEAIASSLEVDLVLYDETEYFDQYYSPNFNYPFEKRKSKLAGFNLNTKLEATNYVYPHQHIDFMVS